MEEWNKMTVPQLKTECTNRGLDVTGKKAELVERLNAHEKNGDAVVEVPDDDDDVVEIPDDDEGDAKDEDGDVKDEDGDAQEEDGDAPEEDGDAQDEEMTLVDTAEGDDEDGEDNADDVIGAIDSYMEENEDKKDADGKDKEGKKDDKKKAPKVKVPNKKVVRSEFQQETRVRTVVFGPLEIEDLKGEEMLEYLKGAEQFFVRFATSGKTGHVQLRMKTFEEAKALVETMTSVPFKEGLVIKQLGPDDGGNVDSILKGETDKNQEKFDLRMLYVHNVPESATEDALKALVPEALSACIPRDQDRKPKGYAFLEFETEAKMDEIHKKVSDLTLDGKNLTLHQIPNADYNRRGSFKSPGNRSYGGNRGGGNRNNRQDNRGYQNRDRGRQNYGGNRNQGGRNWSGGNVRPLLGQQQGGGNYGGNRGNQGGAGGVDAMNLLVGLSQMLNNQQGGGGGGQGGGGGGGNPGYRAGNQGYNDGGYQGGYQGGTQGGGNYNRKRRGGDDYSGNYGGKRFNKGGGRGRRF